MKQSDIIAQLGGDLFDANTEELEKKVINVSPMLVAILLKSRVSKANIEKWLSSKGMTDAEIFTLFEDAKFYNNIHLKDNEYISYILLWKSIQDNNTNVSVKILDMLNKMQGKYNQEIKVNSNEPIKITFG